MRPEARALGFLRGDVEERYVLRPEALEQAFVLGKVPPGSGDLELVGAITGNLSPPPDGTRGSRLSFTHQGQEAMYVSDAVAIDAAGARLPLELAYSRGQVSIVVPEAWLAKVALPLVIDPMVGSRIRIDSSAVLPPAQVQGMEMRRIDVACGSARNEWLVVWSERFGSSSFDYDVWGQRVGADGALVGPPIPISASTGGDYDLTISYASGADRYLVAWRHDPADNASGDDQRIHARVLNGDGTYSTGVFILDDRPGQDFGPSAAFDGANWYVAFGSGSSNPDVRGRFVSPEGVPGAAADPDTEGDFAGRVSVDVLAGTYLIVWEKGSASGRRVHARTMDTGGAFRTGITLVSQGAGASTQPDVSAGDRGKFLLVWRDEGTGLVMGRRATPLLSFPENAFTVSSPAAPYGNPRAAYAPAKGSWYVVYHSIDDSPSPQDVHGTQVTAGGTALAPERVAGGGGAQVYPEIAWNPAGGEMIALYATDFNAQVLEGQRVALVSPTEAGPSEPRTLAQFRADGVTPLPVGGSVPEASVVLKASLWNLAAFDDFEDRDYTANPAWTVGSGQWRVLDVGTRSQSLVDDGTQSDEWIYTTASGLQAYGTWVYRFGWRDGFTSGENRQAHFYLFMNTPTLSGEGYFVLVTAGNASTRTVSLYRAQGGTATRLIGGDANWTFDTQFHTLKVIRDLDNRFFLYLDGALVGTATDGTFSTAGAMIVRHVAHTTRRLAVDYLWTSAAAGARTLKLQVEVKPAGVPFDWIGGLHESGFVANGAVASVTVPNLRTGRYHWRAVAIDDAGKESVAVPFGGNAETETDFEVLLQAPANFRGTALSPASIRWEWEDIGEENGYVVHDHVHATLGTTGPSILSWTESQGVSENFPYARHVHALDAQGEGPASNSAVRYTLVHDPTGADFALTVVSSNRIDITVAPPPNSAAGLTACRIERSSDGTNWTEPPVKSFDEPGYSKSDTALAPETTYHDRIAYRNGDGVVTAASPARNATTLPSPPPAPTGLSAQPGDRQVALRWNAVAQATGGYRVKRSLASGGPYDVIADGVSGTSWTDANLANGVRYDYVVTAVNPGGESPPSAKASATPGVPPPPANLAARVERGVVTLTWDASPSATSYNVYRGTSPGGPYPTPVASGVAGTSATDAPDVFGTTYYYVVTGRNLYGEGLPSNEASAFIPPRPSPPTNVRTTSYATVVDVEWDPSPSPDVAGYNVYRKLESDPVWPTVPLNGDRLVLNTRYRDGTVVTGRRYLYRVTAVGR